MLFNIIFFTLFIILSAFFSGSETAIFSLSPLRLRNLQQKHSKAKAIKEILNRPARYLATIVFGNMLVNTGISALTTAILVSLFGGKGLALAVFLSGAFILFFGEILPKTIAIYLAEKMALLTAPVLIFFSRLFALPVFVIEKIVKSFSWFLVFVPHRTTFSAKELKTALLLSRKDGHISPQEEEMISHVLEFKDTWVSEAITPRVEIRGIEAKLSQEEVIRFLNETKHSKIPVYEGSMDHIVGILYAKDIFINPGVDYHKLLRKPLFVPESKKIGDLLKIFLEKHERVAVVLDEYGGTDGIVTLEDIQEEIFGEIYDEFEVSTPVIEKISEGLWRIYGKTPVKTVNLVLDLRLPEEEVTLAGFLLSQLEKIPQPQEMIRFKKVEFTIERVTPKRIVTVLVRVIGE